MVFSIRRVNTLIIKEMKDMLKNINVFGMCLLPLILAILYSQMISGDGRTNILSLFLIMNSCMIIPMVMAMLIAEEKEKNTMRTLMLSTVSPLEFLTSKAIVTWVTAAITNLGIFLALEVDTKYILAYLVVAILLSTSMILMGAVVGILSKDLMSSGINGMPIILLFFVIPSLASKNKTLEKITDFLPTYHSELLFSKIMKGDNILLTGRLDFLVLLIWILIAGLSFIVIFKRKRLDD